MVKLRTLTVCALAICIHVCSIAAQASTCQSGNLSTIVGTTCSIGSTTFTFGSLVSLNLVQDNTNQTITHGTEFTASDFNFDPLANGFSLDFLGGPQVVTAPADGHVFDTAQLQFSFTDPMGISHAYITPGGSDFQSAFSVSGSGQGQALAFNSNIIDQTPGGPPVVQGLNQLFDLNGVVTSSLNYHVDSNPPITTSDAGYAVVFLMDVTNGYTAGASVGETAFTFSGGVPSVPEPTTILLVAVGFVLATASCRRLFDRCW